jgi:hypothetical protein
MLDILPRPLAILRVPTTEGFPAMKYTSTYVTPEGETVHAKRGSKRTYTHCVWINDTSRAGWGSVGFCGRADLAEKEAARWIKQGYETAVTEVEVTA